MTTTSSPDIVFVTGIGLRSGFSEMVTNGDQIIIVTSKGVPNAIIRPFQDDEESRFLTDLSLLTVPLRDVVKQFRQMRQRIATEGNGQAAISRVPAFQQSEELLKIITLIPRNEADRLTRNLLLDASAISDLSKFRTSA